MVKISYTMEVDIDLEFDDTQIEAVEATDLIDHFANVKVELDDERVNILGAALITM